MFSVIDRKHEYKLNFFQTKHTLIHTLIRSIKVKAMDETMIQTPNLGIKKWITDADHTKSVIGLLIDQTLRTAKQKFQFEACLAVRVDSAHVDSSNQHANKYTILNQTMAMDADGLKDNVWWLYKVRSTALKKFRWAPHIDRDLEDPENTVILINIDGKILNFDIIKHSQASVLRARIDYTNKWISSYRELQRKNLIEQGAVPMLDDGMSEFFKDYSTSMQLRIADHLYIGVAQILGKKRLDDIKKQMQDF